ncbi:cdc42 effector protein 4 [Cyprinodon tularosa]|uniref:cdc42 effector protein 4 n=1 Tax=Cyprinodon tularosa TaxID=77115 RepID=UPI0018E22537|nr:cdc42 effector protein 4 [Cyprinodon tularosa]
MPILKQLVNNSSQSKRRSRGDLTVEMISAPMGDFRHTMHVGRGGDAFGDTSFLSSRSGEPPREPPTKQASPGTKPGLLTRTFRSSKRSHSVNRGDNLGYSTGSLPSGSTQFVKTATSLPYLNDDSSSRSNALPNSASSPMKTLAEAEKKPMNGGAALATIDAELEERNFGEIKELPPSMPKRSGMKHAESIMSFHIDLGPSMLGDILSVMEKKSWEDDDLGYEEGRVNEEHASPSHIPHIDDDNAEERAPSRPPRGEYQLQQTAEADPHIPELDDRNHHNTDSCSVSSSGSEKPQYNVPDADSAKYSSPRGEDDFTFMDQEDDEIRV